MVSDTYILKKSLLFDGINSSHPFCLWYCYYFTGALEEIHYVKSTVLISQHFLHPSIITSGLYGWFKKVWRILCLLEENDCSQCPFKGAYSFHITIRSNFCLKNIVLNAQIYLQPSNSFAANVLIWQFCNSNCSY